MGCGTQHHASHQGYGSAPCPDHRWGCIWPHNPQGWTASQLPCLQIHLYWIVKPCFSEMWTFWWPGTLHLAVHRPSITCSLLHSWCRWTWWSSCVPGAFQWHPHTCLESELGIALRSGTCIFCVSAATDHKYYSDFSHTQCLLLLQCQTWAWVILFGLACRGKSATA